MTVPVERLEGDHIALTFDDGPHPEGTPRLLAALADLDVLATFFVLGWRVEEHPDLIDQIAAAGHAIAVHAWDHIELRGEPSEVVLDQLGRTAEAIASRARPPKWFRPPYGWYDDVVLAAADQLGLGTVLWSIDPRDWDQVDDPAVISARVVDELHPGAIVLLHDGGRDRRATAAAIAPIVAAASGAGLAACLLQ
jgi:peptidoglycan/xylan/chitin deacetylase (PgdA/CDA1 family)